jgi:hypothetical protein
MCKLWVFPCSWNSLRIPVSGGLDILNQKNVGSPKYLLSTMMFVLIGVDQLIRLSWTWWLRDKPLRLDCCQNPSYVARTSLAGVRCTALQVRGPRAVEVVIFTWCTAGEKIALLRVFWIYRFCNLNSKVRQHDPVALHFPF